MKYYTISKRTEKKKAGKSEDTQLRRTDSKHVVISAKFSVCGEAREQSPEHLHSINEQIGDWLVSGFRRYLHIKLRALSFIL